MKNNPSITEKLKSLLSLSDSSKTEPDIQVIESPQPIKETVNGREFLNNCDDDALSTNLFSSIMGVIEERRQMFSLLKEYKEQIIGLQLSLDNMGAEKKELQNFIEQKEKRVSILQVQLTEQKEQYGQLMEEYKQLRISETKERERLNQQIKELQANYELLNGDYWEFKLESSKAKEKAEGMLREEKEKNVHLQAQYQKAYEDNTGLIQKINAFTNQISSLQPVKEEVIAQTPRNEE